MKRIAADYSPALPVQSTDATATSHSQARLSLGFADDAGTTRLVDRSHFGPLRVQKPLYPEGPQICHAIVVHPPGGVVGGDELLIDTTVRQAACAFVTTPGAAKWYKANGRLSRQQVRLQVQAHATLEWLPQETIFFNDAHVQLDHAVELDANASYIGSEILCFGRTASGETFTSGRIAQRTSICYGGKLIWFEQGALSGGSAAMQSALALNGHTVCASLIAVGKVLPAALVQAIRQQAALVGGAGMVGVTQMKSVLVIRYLGNSSEIARQMVITAWQLLRPALLGREAVVPRIWNT